MEITNNVKDTALIFEGGGMRASYTAGFLNTLLENEIYFDYVAGISAGSSHTVNYVSRDMDRAKRSFVDLVLDPKFGGWGSFIRGEGFFRSGYLYEETPLPDASLPFDFGTFTANPARVRIGAFELDGGMEYFGRETMQKMGDLFKIVRSSSSLPFFMPPTHFEDRCYVDGGLGGGIALDIAKEDGMKKFFVVLSQVKGYRKNPSKHPGLLKAYYRRHPLAAEALLNRYTVYNRTLDELEQLEKEGKAYLVYPEVMPVTTRETNYNKLARSYESGYAQGRRDLPKWKEFLGLK
jgi:predicted patatin/cPLA2 family phospholipase